MTHDALPPDHITKHRQIGLLGLIRDMASLAVMPAAPCRFRRISGNKSRRIRPLSDPLRKILQGYNYARRPWNFDRFGNGYARPSCRTRKPKPFASWSSLMHVMLQMPRKTARNDIHGLSGPGPLHGTHVALALCTKNPFRRALMLERVSPDEASIDQIAQDLARRSDLGLPLEEPFPCRRAICQPHIF
jgi:hypothetical protein